MNIRRASVGFVALFCVHQGMTLIAQESLADVARKESERRATVAEPARVYTNADIRQFEDGHAEPTPAAFADSCRVPMGTDTKGLDANTPIVTPAKPLTVKEADGLLGKRVASLADQIDKARHVSAEYRLACTESIPAVSTSEVALGFSPIFKNENNDNSSTPYCRTLAKLMSDRVAFINQEVRDVNEEARVRGISPGVMRDVFKMYHIEQ